MQQHSFKIDISELQKGRKKAFESVYFEFYDVLYHLALQYLKNEDQAKEAIQVVFMKLWENRTTLSAATNIKNFLYTLLKNYCLNQLRDQLTFLKHADNLKYQQSLFSYDSLNRLSDEYIIVEELKIKIDNILKTLKPDIQLVFALNRFQSLTYKEIAEQLSVSTKTVEARMSKALSALRSGLSEYLI